MTIPRPCGKATCTTLGDVENYAELMQEAQNGAVQDLAKCYRENPQLFD